jgi:hypothetical protein
MVKSNDKKYITRSQKKRRKEDSDSSDESLDSEEELWETDSDDSEYVPHPK